MNPNKDKQSKAVVQHILQRKSVRHYSNTPIPEEDLELLIKVGMSAPTAVNRQPWLFFAVTDRSQLDILGDGLPHAKMLLHAPACIIVCGDIRHFTDKEAKYWVQDTCAATQNILLAAEALGYGAVWTAVYPEPDRMEVVGSTLNLPTRVIPLNVIPLGIPESGRDFPKDKWDPRRFYRDRWEEKMDSKIE